MSYESALLDLALRDERIMVLTAENRAPIRGLPASLGDRFVDMFCKVKRIEQDRFFAQVPPLD